MAEQIKPTLVVFILESPNDVLIFEIACFEVILIHIEVGRVVTLLRALGNEGAGTAVQVRFLLLGFWEVWETDDHLLLGLLLSEPQDLGVS